MPGQSSIDPLASAVAAAVAHPAVEASQSEPSSLSQAIAMRVIDALAETLVIAALLGELGLVLGNVFARAYFHHSFLWADEVARLSLSILAFIGGAVAYRRRDHAFVRVVLNLVPRPVERACLVLSDVIVLFVVGLTGIASAEFIGSSWGERTPIFQIPAALIALPLPVGMALLALYAVNNLYRENRRVIWGVGAGFTVVLAAAAVARDLWLPWLGGDAAIIVALALFFVAIFAGVPVGFVLLLATATYLWAADAASFVVLPQTMVNGTGNFILLAVPFFILAGLVMERGGISVRLVRFISRWSATGAAGSSKSPLRACMSFPAYLVPNRRTWRRSARSCAISCASAMVPPRARPSWPLPQSWAKQFRPASPCSSLGRSPAYRLRHCSSAGSFPQP